MCGTDSSIDEQESLADIPNAISYQRIVETDRAGYMVRQYLYSSLYDRIRYLYSFCPT